MTELKALNFKQWIDDGMPRDPRTGAVYLLREDGNLQVTAPP